MARAEDPALRRGLSPALRRRLRLGAAWVLSALLFAAYFALPDSDDAAALPAAAPHTDAAGEPRKLDIVDVSPPSASPGDAVTITFTGVADADTGEVKVLIAKEEVEILARRPGALVARLPQTIEIGRAKLRIAIEGERSKPYDLRIKSWSWRKPFRNLVGGFALLLFGIAVFARGVGGAAGFRSAHTLARLGRRPPAALGFGGVLGALLVSTTASAGVLAGLVSSRLLALAPAAAAFLGALIGSAAAPLLTGLIDPREGLLLVAMGVLFLGLASDRRASAFGRMVLGAGLIAFGLQTMRPGFDLITQDPRLLAIVSRISADSVRGVAACALLGAALVAILQGPAPVVVLVLVLVQTTARWDLRTALAVLAGSGLGAAVGALVTTPAGRRCRQLAELHLLLGFAATVLSASTVVLWTAVADRLIPGSAEEISWGRRVLMPNMALHLGAAFALSQLASAVVLLPFIRPLARLVERLDPLDRAVSLAKVGDGDGVGFAARGLDAALATAQRALQPTSELALEGRREAGRAAEHALSDAHVALEELLSGTIPALPESEQRTRLGRLAFATLQVQRALWILRKQAEHLTDSRMAEAGGRERVVPLPAEDESTLRDMHGLLSEGLGLAMAAIAGRAPLDLEAARGREIRMNGLEARARAALLAGGGGTRKDLGVLELADAYETAGNQLYRLVEAAAQSIELVEPEPEVSSKKVDLG
jgi:phosphate:Na+ symporter